MAQDAQKTAIAGAPADAGPSPLARQSDARLKLDQARVRPQRSLWSNAWRQFRRHKLAMAGLVVFCAFILITAIGPFVYGRPVNSPFEYDTSVSPSLDHLMGTDSMGQDLLARILYGGRISLAVGLVAASVAILIGTLVGAIAGFFGGFIDNILMRFVDVVISVPGITLLLLVSVWWRPGPVGLAVVIASISWTGISRLIRGEVLALRHREFVEAARLVGASDARIIISHIFPNVLSIIIVWASLALPGLIIYEATLSYLGFGVRIPIPSWGNMLSAGRKVMVIAPWTAVYPGLAIVFLVLGFNLLGDGLRDILDPRLKNAR